MVERMEPAMLLMVAALADEESWANLGRAKADSMAKITITMINSIRVKPFDGKIRFRMQPASPKLNTLKKSD
ncbi:hypothetical protein GCM10007876_15370 [Litoribrevibacter albus]|uniref:Uncharacterized protein n=1 Tax=Litoribrevibacter albus TaxID=1473156 RepID=A0AA37S9S3_9GAMM|nr:hypothetical protein GCM10007876_15370 [Litoribrevibacter albus]